jgi:hypothetical protein
LTGWSEEELLAFARGECRGPSSRHSEWREARTVCVSAASHLTHPISGPHVRSSTSFPSPDWSLFRRRPFVLAFYLMGPGWPIRHPLLGGRVASSASSSLRRRCEHLTTGHVLWRPEPLMSTARSRSDRMVPSLQGRRAILAMPTR